MGVFRAAEVNKSGCLNSIFNVGFNVHSATSAQRDSKQKNWQKVGERKVVGDQGQTDEPYLS